MGEHNIQLYKYTVAAGQSQVITAAGRFIRGVTGSARYQVSVDGSQPKNFETGLAFEQVKPFSQVTIINTSSSSQIIELAISERPVFDNRLVGNVDISGGIRTAANRSTAYGAVSVGVAATLIRVENTARGKCLVQNLSANIIHIGSDNLVTAANGIEVGIGGSMEITFDDDIYGIAGGAASDIRYLEETL